MQVSPIPIQAVVAGSTPLCRGGCRRDRTGDRMGRAEGSLLDAIPLMLHNPAQLCSLISDNHQRLV